MNKKQEIEKLKIEIAKSIGLIEGVATRISQLESECKVEAKGRYQPEDNCEYYFKGADGFIYKPCWHNSSLDKHRYRTRNCFRTKALAKLDLKRDLAVASFMDIVEEENAKFDWVADWNDKNQPKGQVFFDYSTGSIGFENYRYVQLTTELPAISPEALKAVKSRLTTEMINLIFRIGAEWEL